MIDASGLVVAPGFVDMLADNAHRPEKSYRIFEKYKLADGVTSSLQLHGGVASARRYRDTMGECPHLVNHGVSTKVMRIRKQTRSVEKRLAKVRRSLEEGSLAISHSIEYQPTPLDELLLYGALAREWDVPFFLHLRHSSFEKELDGVREALEIGRRTGCHVHLDHLHSTGASWHMDEAIELVEEALQEGQRITACVYPYTFWATYVHSKRFAPGWRERYDLDWDDLRLLGSAERLTRRRFRELRNKTWALVAVPEGIMDMEKVLLPALKRPWMAISSDGGIEREPDANNHPRGAGCFATAMRLGIDRGLGLSETIAKVTALPSLILGARSSAMRARGGLGPGDVADVVVFDPETINGRATVEVPAAVSDGIEHVLLGGRASYRGGGVVLRDDGGVLLEGDSG